MTFTVGLAVGYVLGSRAGRKKYEHIVAALRNFHSHPMVQEAQQAVKEQIRATAVRAAITDTDSVALNRAQPT
jgi:hypothetical protein